MYVVSIQILGGIAQAISIYTNQSASTMYLQFLLSDFHNQSESMGTHMLDRQVSARRDELGVIEAKKPLGLLTYPCTSLYSQSGPIPETRRAVSYSPPFKLHTAAETIPSLPTVYFDDRNMA